MHFFGGGLDVNKLAQKRDIKGLVKALKNQNTAIQEDAANALIRLSDLQAVPLLIEMLSENEAHLYEPARYVLANLGLKSVDGLIAALPSLQGAAQERAIGILGELGDSRAVEPLLALLGASSSKAVDTAAYALGNIGDKRAREGLLARLNDKGSSVETGVIFALGQVGAGKTVALLESLLAQGLSDNLRDVASQAIENIRNPQTIQTLIDQLRDSKSEVREAAARELGELGDVRALDALVKAAARESSYPSPLETALLTGTTNTEPFKPIVADFIADLRLIDQDVDRDRISFVSKKHRLEDEVLAKLKQQISGVGGKDATLILRRLEVYPMFELRELMERSQKIEQVMSHAVEKLVKASGQV